MDSDLFRWRDDPEIAEVVLSGALPALAAGVLDCDPVVFVEDQWIASEPGASSSSPWHQDAPYYNIDADFVTLWIALDPAGPANALRVVRGSHLGPEFAPVEFATSMTTIGVDGADHRAAPPIDPEAEGLHVLRWSVRPGDVIVLHSRALHAAGGTAIDDRWFRRLSVRYAPANARYTDRGATAASFWRTLPHGRHQGGPLTCDLFPTVRVGASDGKPLNGHRSGWPST